MSYKASIVIPVYNAEKTIRKCVESLVYGRERNIEVILVEDHSKDDSWNVCQKLSEEFSNVVSIRNDKNRGVSYTRNHGLAHVSSEYCLFVDSDDWVSKDYVFEFLNIGQDNNDYMVFCGYRFLDYTLNLQRDYLYDEDEIISIVQKKHYFSLIDKVMIQSPVNKLFITKIIRDNHLQFDVLKSMGEDFDFVLDYMACANFKAIKIINKPLYYYIRANNASLMSKSGLTGYEDGVKRIYKLQNIANLEYIDKYINDLQHYHMYNISMHYNKKDAIKEINKITKENNGSTYYNQYRNIHIKEKIWVCINKIKSLSSRIKGRLDRDKQSKFIANYRNKLNNSDYSIISQNCIGGVFYHDMNSKFLSPTINLYFSAIDFVKFSLNLDYYLEQEVVMQWDEEYPVGKLDDIEIRFMHYETCKEAYEKWNERKQRINKDKIIIISTDREEFNEEVYNLWKQIKYPKLLFTAHKEFIEDALYYDIFNNEGYVGDLISSRLFYKDDKLIEKINQL